MFDMDAKPEVTDSDSVPTLKLETQRTVDSEIEAHLDHINKAIDEINNLSKDFMKFRDEFIKCYEVAKAKLAQMYAAEKKAVDRARPFYIARDEAYRAKFEHKKSTTKFKKACEDLKEAKAAAKKTEEVLMSSASAGRGGTTDPELLSNLNIVNDRVLETTRSRELADHDQACCMTALSKTDGYLANLAQHLSKYVLKASSYFDTRDKMQRQLDGQYYKLWEKNKRLQEAKELHQDLFTEFSAISTEFSQIDYAEDFRSAPPDLSKFEEIDDVDNIEVSMTTVSLI